MLNKIDVRERNRTIISNGNITIEKNKISQPNFFSFINMNNKYGVNNIAAPVARKSNSNPKCCKKNKMLVENSKLRII